MIPSQPEHQDFGVVTTTSSTIVTEQQRHHHHHHHQQQQQQQQVQQNDYSMMLLHNMCVQIEFYFSTNNYTRDTFLQQVVATHQGSVPIGIIAQFPKIQQLYYEMMQYYHANNHPTFVAPIEVMVCRSLVPSRVIDVSNDGCFLRPNWSALQDREVSLSNHVPPMDSLLSSDQSHQVVKPNGMNHTDATNTTVSPTSFASGSDGSIGHQSTSDAVVAVTVASVATTTKATPPSQQQVPVLFNPTGGVYYTQSPQNFHYPVFGPTTIQHYPAMGVVASSNMYPYYHADPNLQFYLPQHQYSSQLPPTPSSYPQNFPQPNPPPPPISHLVPAAHPIAHYNIDQRHHYHPTAMNDHYANIPSPKTFPILNTQIVNQPSIPSPVSINAPPSVIRLQDPFPDDVVRSRNNASRNQPGNRKTKTKGSSRNKSRTSSSSTDASNRNNDAGSSRSRNGLESKKRSPSIPVAEPQEKVVVDTSTERFSDEAIATGTSNSNYPTTASSTKTDTDDGDESSRTSIPKKKEKNRISAANQNRATAATRHPSNRSTASIATEQPTQHRSSTLHPQQDRSTKGIRGAVTKGRSNSNTQMTASKREANILIDENFPCLTKNPLASVSVTVENKVLSMEDSTTKKKYAEAVLHNPVILKFNPTQSSSIGGSAGITTDTDAIATSISVVGVVIPVNIPTVTNLLDKFNMNE